MQYTVLGRTGVTVSRVCFGTMSFGAEADEAASAALFKRCRDAGVNFFDCANIYTKGRAEEILGKLIERERDELVITSKVASPMGPGPNDGGLARRNIVRSVEASLRRLRTDRLDVYFCHLFDAKTPIEETWAALDDLVRVGKVLYPGISNWSAWQVAKCLGIAERKGLTPPFVLQPMYSLAKRIAEVELLPMARAEGLAVTPYSPLGGGLLTGKYTRSQRDPQGRLVKNPRYAQRYAEEWQYKLAEDFTGYAKTAGVHPATLAVAWVMANPAITAPILGARSVEQLEPALAAADYAMSPEQYRDLCALTPPVPVATDRTEEKA